MKKSVFLGLMLLTGVAWGACMGPFCWDDRGAYVNGIVQDGNGRGMPSKTVTQLQTTAPTAAGQEIYCSNCATNGGLGTICVSTGTAAYAYSLSTGTVCK